MKNKKVLCTSLAAILLAMSVGIGATYALFTSSSKVDTVITTAKVNVKASATNLKTYSGVWNETTNAYEYVEQSDLTFTNGGSVSLIDDILTINKITPLDKVTFDIALENLSDINILFRTLIKCEGSTSLFNALDVKIGGISYNGTTKVSSWENLAPSEGVDSVSVSIELPETSTSDVCGLSSKIVYSIEAIQANAKVENPDPNSLMIYNSKDYLAFMNDLNNGEEFDGKNVELLTDLDFENVNIPYSNDFTFKGIFKGNGHTISNLKYEDYTHEVLGLFPILEGKIQDLNLSKVNFKAKSTVGALCGLAKEKAKITNCNVFNSNIEARASENSGGTFAGGLIGKTESDVEIENNDVKETKVRAYTKFGGLVGELSGKIKDCLLLNSEVIQDSINGYGSELVFDYEIGSVLSDATIDNLENINNELYSIVTPENLNKVDFKQNERLYKFYGDFEGEKLGINSTKDLIQEFDGSHATFNVENLRFDFLIIDSLSNIVTDETNVADRQFKERVGQYKINNFIIPKGSFSIGSQNSNIELGSLKGLAIDFDSSNCRVTIKDSEFKLESGSVYRFDGNKKEYVFYMLAVNYDLIMENTLIYCQNKNALNFFSRGEWDIADFQNGNAGNYVSANKINNSISVTGSTITSVNDKAINIWGDHTYGSNYILGSGKTVDDLPFATKALIKSLVENNAISVKDNSKYMQFGQLVLDKITCESL